MFAQRFKQLAVRRLSSGGSDAALSSLLPLPPPSVLAGSRRQMEALCERHRPFEYPGEVVRLDWQLAVDAVQSGHSRSPSTSQLSQRMGAACCAESSPVVVEELLARSGTAPQLQEARHQAAQGLSCVYLPAASVGGSFAKRSADCFSWRQDARWTIARPPRKNVSREFMLAMDFEKAHSC